MFSFVLVEYTVFMISSSWGIKVCYRKKSIILVQTRLFCLFSHRKSNGFPRPPHVYCLAIIWEGPYSICELLKDLQLELNSVWFYLYRAFHKIHCHKAEDWYLHHSVPASFTVLFFDWPICGALEHHKLLGGDT